MAVNKDNFYSSFIDKLNEQNLITDKDNKNNIENIEDIQSSFDTVSTNNNITYNSDNFYDDFIYKLDKENKKNINYSVLGSDISTTRKVQFGARQEPMIVGSAVRLGRAGLASLFSDETFDEAAQRIEAARQEKIFQDFPEFRGKKEDLTVLSGRMGVALADPVTFFIPWTKVAKAGKVATVATGAGVASADMALREKALYGDINIGAVGISAALGGTSTALGTVIANKLRGTTAQDKILTVDKKGNPITSNLTNTDPVFVGPLSKEMRDSLEQISLDSFELSQPFITSFQDNISSLGVKYTKRDRLTSELKKLENIPQSAKEQGTLPFDLKTKNLNEQISNLKKELKTNQKEIDNILFIEQPKNISITGFNSLRKAHEAGLLTGKIGENITRAFVHELVRPLVGATAGGAVALVSSEGETDTALNAALIAGATLGFLNKRLDNSKVIPREVRSIVADESQKVFTHGWRTWTRRLLAGSEAGKGTIQIEPVRKFFSDLYSSRGQAGDLGNVLEESVEELKDKSLEFYRKLLFDATADFDDDTILAAGRLLQQHNMPSNSKYSFLEKGDLENLEAKNLFTRLLSLREDSFVPYLKGTGLKITNNDTYGLTQILDTEKINQIGRRKAEIILTKAYQLQAVNARKALAKSRGVKVSTLPKINMQEIEAKALNHLNNADSIRRNEVIGMTKFDSQNTEAGNLINFITNEGKTIRQNDTLMQSAKFVDNERVLVDQEARALAKELFIQDPEFTLSRLFENTIPIAEFSRRFGPRGQGIKDTIEDVKNYYKQFGNIKSNQSLQKLINEELNSIANSTNAYFGTFGASSVSSQNDFTKSVILTLQTLLATTKLTKVAIPSIGDLLQTMQNSGFKSSLNSLITQVKQQGSKANKPSAMLAQRVGRDEDGVLFNEPLLGRKFKNRRYNGTLEKELNDFNLMATTDYQRFLLRGQRRFFEIVQLGRVTRFAREFAYDAGAFRAFDLGKLASKGKLKQARLRELNSLGLSVEDAKYLGQFKSMDEAYTNVQGKFLIDKAGRKAANRDALIPQVGNRRLFAQSRSPYMKFAGSFLSWAQAKTTQTNSLLRRIEDGDGKLALMMLTTLPLYGTIRYLQTQLNPTESFREEFENPLETKEDLLKFLADTGIFSAQLMPYWADKIFSSAKYNKNNAVENIYPVFGLVNDAVAGGFDMVTGKPATGAVKIGETLVPGLKEITRREELLGIDALGRKEGTEDFKALDTKDEILPRMATGGLITGPEVPYTKENAADRVDPFTGSPYSDQMARLGLAKGGLTDAEVLSMVEDKAWFQRATQPGGELYKGKHTLLTRSSSDGQKEYLYPTIREVDGKLVDLGDKAFDVAIEKKDFLVFEGKNKEKQATEVSKKISDLIMPMRELNKKMTEDRLGLQDGGVPEGAVRIYDEDQGLQPVLPVIELLVGGAGRILAPITRRGADAVEETIRQKYRTFKIPKEVYHGGPKTLTDNVIKSQADLVNANQAAVFTTTIRKAAEDYAQGKKGKVYEIDTLKNINAKIFNPTKIDRSFKTTVNNEIKKNKDIIKQADNTSVIGSRDVNIANKNIEQLNNLLRLDKLPKPKSSSIITEGNYVSRISPYQKDILTKGGYDVIDDSNVGSVLFLNQVKPN